ncbi:hypothetical protein LLH23_08085, partial [bacterium]|nr:hypothetical protein [bacterium]MCE5238438.1 hypothetical protein [bacterium]
MYGSLRRGSWMVIVVLGLLSLAWFAGCGGGGGRGGGDTQPEPTAEASPYSAHFHVDVTTGAVTITPPGA